MKRIPNIYFDFSITGCGEKKEKKEQTKTEEKKY